VAKVSYYAKFGGRSLIHCGLDADKQTCTHVITIAYIQQKQANCMHYNDYTWSKFTVQHRLQSEIGIHVELMLTPVSTSLAFHNLVATKSSKDCLLHGSSEQLA